VSFVSFVMATIPVFILAGMWWVLLQRLALGAETLARFESETRAAQARLRQSMWRTTLDVAWRRPLEQHHGRPALAVDPRAEARIDAWLAAR
jgi:hypothetical protein